MPNRQRLYCSKDVIGSEQTTFINDFLNEISASLYLLKKKENHNSIWTKIWLVSLNTFKKFAQSINWHFLRNSFDNASLIEELLDESKQYLLLLTWNNLI